MLSHIYETIVTIFHEWCIFCEHIEFENRLLVSKLYRKTSSWLEIRSSHFQTKASGEQWVEC